MASCHSEFAGKIFLASGAKHVICVDYDYKIADEAVLKFTETFYELIFEGESVCDAFDHARDSVAFDIKDSELEASKFKILLPSKRQKEDIC